MSTLGFCIAFGCVFVAGIVRGFAGFGFSLLSVSSVALVLPPAIVVPSMWILDFVAGVNLLPGIYAKVQWRSIAILIGSAIVATPFGVFFLANVSGAWMRVALAVVVLASAALLLSGYQLRRVPTAPQQIATGAAAGALNGAFGLGGIPIVVFYLGSPIALEVGRASIIAAFLAMDIVGLPTLLAFGLLQTSAWTLIAVCLPALVAGVFVGARLVGKADPARVRTILLWLLFVMALAMGTQGLLELAWS
jgi:uncharacterized protein